MAEWVRCPRCRGNVGIPANPAENVLCPNCREVVFKIDPVSGAAWKPVAPPGWMKPAGYLSIGIGVLGFLGSTMVAWPKSYYPGASDYAVALLAGLLNPLAFIGIPLGWYWLRRSAIHSDLSDTTTTSSSIPSTSVSLRSLQPAPTLHQVRPMDISRGSKSSSGGVVGYLALASALGVVVTIFAIFLVALASSERGTDSYPATGMASVPTSHELPQEGPAASNGSDAEAFDLTSGSNAVRRGSFAAWTVPEDPRIGQDYIIVIEVTLPRGTERYEKADLSGQLIGTDGYKVAIPDGREWNGHGWTRAMRTPAFRRDGDKARVTFFIRGAHQALVRDTILIQSKLLNEQQKLQITF